MIRMAGYLPEVDIPIEIVGLRPGEKLYEELLNDTAKTIPTYHEKILIAQETSKSCPQFQDRLTELFEAARQLDNKGMIGLMKIILPDYKSMNSVYEQYDVKSS
jgi:FlaA1/EpsC-like NDP-sugar epimerase